MASAILNAILTANETADGDIYVDPEHVQEALIIALATIIEAQPGMTSGDDLQRASEAALMTLNCLRWRCI